MNSDLLIRLLQTEAENLYHQDSTPEAFVSWIRPLIQSLAKENCPETMSEADLEGILISSRYPEKSASVRKSDYFDIVDLSMYRAN